MEPPPSGVKRHLNSSFKLKSTERSIRLPGSRETSFSSTGRKPPVSKPGNLSAHVPLLEFTIDEKIKLIAKIQAGDFIMGAGLQQFCQEKSKTCAKSLAKEFATLNRSDKKNPKLTLKSPCTDYLDQKKREYIDFMDNQVDDYAKLPAVDKKINDTVVATFAHAKYFNSLEEVAARSHLYRCLKPKRFLTVVRKCQKIIRTCKIFQTRSLNSKMRFFEPIYSGQQSMFSGQGAIKEEESYWRIPCDIRDAEKIINSLKLVTTYLTAIRPHIRRYSTAQLEIKFKRFGELADKFVLVLNELEQQRIRRKQLFETGKDAGAGSYYEDSSSDSSGIEFDDSD